MTLWIVFAVMTAAAVLAVLWPLGRNPAFAAGGSDRAVYRDQLVEIDRDRGAGLIGEAEADSARVEISRRLLAAAAAETQGPAAAAPPQASRHRRIATIATIVVVPAIALGLYLKLGSPDVPDQSAFARDTGAGGDQSIASLVSQVEAHLASNPNDGQGWQVIAPVYLKMGRFNDAVTAWHRAIALNGESAVRESGLGEALVAAANGAVTDDAKKAFEAAVASDPQEVKARYFLGLADEQDGNREAAAAKWRALLNDATGYAPWANFVRAALARVTGEAASGNGPTAGDVAAAEGLSDTQRTEMIRGMVQRLFDRLRGDGNDVEDWLRLVRAYAVLGDRDKAKGAAADARRALASRPDDIKRIDDLAKGLGLEG
jgi:cytochrome c-type biogenesis protein CcmH